MDKEKAQEFVQSIVKTCEYYGDYCLDCPFEISKGRSCIFTEPPEYWDIDKMIRRFDNES